MTRVYSTPSLDRADGYVTEMIAGYRDQLSHRVAEPRRWSGKLRRMSLARAVQASNSIEGYDASLDDVMAAVDRDSPLDANEETRFALEGYRDAMTYVLQLAQEPSIKVDATLIKSLHYMMMKHDLSTNPGRWRPGVIFVRRESSGEVVYEGPEADALDDLVSSMLEELETRDAPVLVRAAMAHLNLVMIHPFSDCNGRMARCLQTLILAREQTLVPEFSSIEEYLGRNTSAYYEVLAAVGQGAWHPENDAHPWVKFCLTAHYRQARTLLRRIVESEKLWVHCADLAERHKLPERCIGPMWDAAIGLRLRNSTFRSSVQYGNAEEISNLTATRDLKALVERGLLSAIGQARGRYYVGTKTLGDAWESVRAARLPRVDIDPYELAETADPDQLKLLNLN